MFELVQTVCSTLPHFVDQHQEFLKICTAIPRDMLPLDMLTPQIRHYELRQKIPDTLILVIYLPPAMLFLVFFKKIPDMLI